MLALLEARARIYRGRIKMGPWNSKRMRRSRWCGGCGSSSSLGALGPSLCGKLGGLDCEAQPQVYFPSGLHRGQSMSARRLVVSFLCGSRVAFSRRVGQRHRSRSRTYLHWKSQGAMGAGAGRLGNTHRGRGNGSGNPGAETAPDSSRRSPGADGDPGNFRLACPYVVWRVRTSRTQSVNASGQYHSGRCREFGKHDQALGRDHPNDKVLIGRADFSTTPPSTPHP